MLAWLLDLRIAAWNLIQHRRRSLLLGTALALMTALFVLLFALSRGITHSVVDTATSLVMGHVNITGYFKLTRGDVSPTIADYARLQADLMRAAPEVEAVVARGRGLGKLISERDSVDAVINGIDVPAESRLHTALALRAGRFEDLTRPNAILLFEAQATKLQVDVGDALTLAAQTMSGAANTLDCQVVAVARDAGIISGSNVFVSSTVLRELYALNAQTSSVLQLYMAPEAARESVQLASRVRGALTRAGWEVLPAGTLPSWLKMQGLARESWTGQRLDVTTWQNELALLMWTLQALEALGAVLITILAGIVALGIANTLAIAIRERTREIGTLRAIGLHASGVSRMFVIESLLLGAAGGVAGALLGACATWLLNASRIHVPLSMQLLLLRERLELRLELPFIVVAVAATTLVTGLAALYPSLRAARLQPVDAMRHFG